MDVTVCPEKCLHGKARALRAKLVNQRIGRSKASHEPSLSVAPI